MKLLTEKSETTKERELTVWVRGLGKTELKMAWLKWYLQNDQKTKNSNS